MAKFELRFVGHISAKRKLTKLQRRFGVRKKRLTEQKRKLEEQKDIARLKNAELTRPVDPDSGEFNPQKPPF